MNSEEQLIHKLIVGNSSAQYELYNTYAPKLYAVCLRYMQKETEAQDVLQDGFVKIFENIGKYSFTGSFEGWLRRIIVNTCLDQLRKNKRLVDHEDVSDVEYKLSSNVSIISELQANDLLKVIAELPIGYKTIFNMYAIEGYSHKEIAKELGISEGTSKSQYSRARKILMELVIERNLV